MVFSQILQQQLFKHFESGGRFKAGSLFRLHNLSSVARQCATKYTHNQKESMQYLL